VTATSGCSILYPRKVNAKPSPPFPPFLSHSCFQSAPDEPWNWNLYLAPVWALGVAFRHCILFPLRAALLAAAFILFFVAFFGCRPLVRGDARRRWERGCVKALCQAFVASWTGVVRYHGPRPVPRPNHVWVSNHTSMIDYIILCACSPFAVIMQLHPGWVGFLQTQVLNCLGCLWFNRTEVKDRALVADRMRAHVAASPAATPLLIFPEGTCVNNRYCVMFKRGAFDVGAVVCPVAIRYDRVFVDAFWNSKRHSFTAHLAKLMRSWAVVCDVWFLEPQARRAGETAQAFAERVQRLIATRAGLTIAPWDGYLKYYNLGAKV
jgi:glycerol-3-phosphate O-acyltransferase 3/4